MGASVAPGRTSTARSAGKNQINQPSPRRPPAARRAQSKTAQNYSTSHSRVVPHRSTTEASCGLTSEIRRDPVFSTMYGRSWRLRSARADDAEKSGQKGNRAAKNSRKKAWFAWHGAAKSGSNKPTPACIHARRCAVPAPLYVCCFPSVSTASRAGHAVLDVNADFISVSS